MTGNAVKGAKGGSSSSRTPIEFPNSLHSIAYARVLDLLSKGPRGCADATPLHSYDLIDRIIQVPSNYDPETRTYTGIWDGTFKPAWSDNPAWIYYDMVTCPRYGLSHLIPAALIDKWNLYKVGRYSDELVPDGAGGTEPRFRCNLRIQSHADVWKLLQDLASLFLDINSGWVHERADHGPRPASPAPNGSAHARAS